MTVPALAGTKLEDAVPGAGLEVTTAGDDAAAGGVSVMAAAAGVEPAVAGADVVAAGAGVGVFAAIEAGAASSGVDCPGPVAEGRMALTAAGGAAASVLAVQ